MDARRDLDVDAQVLLVGEPAADDRIVRLIPDAPEPVLDAIAAPLLDRAPHDLAAARDERVNLVRAVERRPETRECDHRQGAGIEHALHVDAEAAPVGEWIGHLRIEDENADEPRVHELQAPPDLRAVRAFREMPPAVDLVEAIAQAHAPRGGRALVHAVAGNDT